MTFVEEEPKVKEEDQKAEISLFIRSWWLGKRIDLEMIAPAGKILEFCKEHVPGIKETKDGLETK